MTTRRTSLATLALVIGLSATWTLAQGPGPGPGGPGGPGGRGLGGGGFPPNPLMQALDTDGDGELSAKEIENASTALKALDKDKNGKLTAEEVRPDFGRFGPGGPGGGRGANPQELVAQFMAFDKNEDGKLTREELPERMRGLMDRADTNKDGVVDKAELTKLAESQARTGPGMRGGPRGEQRKDQARPPEDK